jgi:hypothetical protein
MTGRELVRKNRESDVTGRPGPEGRNTSGTPGHDAPARLTPASVITRLRSRSVAVPTSAAAVLAAAAVVASLTGSTGSPVAVSGVPSPTRSSSAAAPIDAASDPGPWFRGKVAPGTTVREQAPATTAASPTPAASGSAATTSASSASSRPSAKRATTASPARSATTTSPPASTTVTPSGPAAGTTPLTGLPAVEQTAQVPAVGPASPTTVIEGTVRRGYGEPQPTTRLLTQAASLVTRPPSLATVDPGADPDEPDLLTWIDTAGDGHVQVPTSQLTGVANGTTVRLRLDAPDAAAAPQEAAEGGTRISAGEVVTPAAGTTAATAAGNVAATTTTVHKVWVVLALPPGSTSDGTTAATITSLVNGPVSTFWSTQTGGRVSFQVQASMGFTAVNSSCTDWNALWSEAATKIGFTPGDGNHLLVYVPAQSACYAGLGTIGNNLSSGGNFYVSYALASVIAHELGHNLSLGHSNGLTCPSASDGVYNPANGTYSNSCAFDGYRDLYDVMGSSWEQIGSLSTAHAEQLGVIGAGLSTVTTPTSATLVPLGTLAGLRGLKVLDPSGAVYYVEYRTAGGQDAWLSDTSKNWRGLKAGITVRRLDPDDPSQTLLIDPSVTTPRDDDWNEVLPVGKILVTSSGRVAIRVDSTGATATVTVGIDGAYPARPPVIGSPASGFTVSRNGQSTTSVVVTGSASGYEGTLVWTVTNSVGTVANGSTECGANGSIAEFSFPVNLGAGSYSLTVTAPDESGAGGSSSSSTAFTVT